MTKSRVFSILFLIVFIGVLYSLRQEKSELPIEKSVQVQMSPTKEPVVDVEKLEIDGKKVVGLPPGKEKTLIKEVHVANRATENWKPELKKALLAQGGPSVKDIKIEKLDSFVWTVSGTALFVETVKITLKNDQNSVVSFNAMVDSQTGKILQNWNQPVIDNFDGRNDLKIHIDPRYHNE